MTVNQSARSPHPLGPLVVRSASTSRTPALLVALCCAILLLVAAWLKPSPNGIGTHEQLGIARCSWPATWGIPCPTCGMTTSFALAVRGKWGAAFRAQPLGLLLALMTAATCVLALAEAATRRRRRINWYRVRPWMVATFGIGTVVAAWGFKILVFRGQMG